MDARRYDRNADLLSQIYWHTNRLNTKQNERAAEVKTRLLELLQEALEWNDELGKMAEMGLI